MKRRREANILMRHNDDVMENGNDMDFDLTMNDKTQDAALPAPDDDDDEMDEQDDDDEEHCWSESEDDSFGVETMEASYWDHLYDHNDEEGSYSEYLISYTTLEPFLLPFFKNVKHALVPGCGDSPFSYSAHVKGGIPQVSSCDISERAIEIMASKYHDHKNMHWFVDDLMESEMADDSYDLVIDKSLLDCIFWVPENEAFADVCAASILLTYHRVLTYLGLCLIVTTRSPDQMLPFFDKGIEHLKGSKYDERRQKNISPLPADWKILGCQFIAAPLVDRLGVPQDAIAKAIQSDDSLQFHPDVKMFYIYTLQKIA